MYTVIRFRSSTTDREQLRAVGEGLNRIKEQTFTGFDRVENRFSCDVCERDDWNEHVRTMIEFLDTFGTVLREALTANLEIEFDVAVEPEDIGEKIYLSFSVQCDLLKKLAEENVRLTLTYYPVRLASSPSGGTS